MILHQVKKIYLADFTGPKEEVEEFIETLREELREAGFELVSEKNQGDGILRGTLSVRKNTDKFGGNLLMALERMGAFALDDEDLLRVTLRLTTPQGKKIWAGNFQRGVRSISGLDLARVRAKDVMKKFMRDVQNSRLMSDDTDVRDHDQDDNDPYIH